MKKALRDKLIAEQRQWIEEHGGCLAGYVERYGSIHDPKHYGDGGEAIFQADYNTLLRLIGRTDLVKSSKRADIIRASYVRSGIVAHEGQTMRLTSGKAEVITSKKPS